MNNVLDSLAARFPSVDVTRAATAARRIYLSVPAELFIEVIGYAAKELGFDHLSTVTGLDSGSGYEFLYHISGPDGILMTLKYKTADGDGVTIPSVLPIYPGASFYERELEGLLGVRVEGLPPDRQYPLPDNWPEGQYPMRKGWKPPSADERRAQAKQDSQEGYRG